MSFQCGIVGLPNIGKSTLFNALTSTQAAESANYPFCTIEPNIGKVAVPDKRLGQLAKLAGSAKIIYTQLEFVDIAGLVKGASAGEGLGNQFLSNIRDVDIIGHVLRCFEDGDITHVEGSVDPLRDLEIIETELILADLAVLEKRVPNLEKQIRGQDKEAKATLDLVQRILPLLEEGKPARMVEIKDNDEAKLLKMLQLLSSKRVMYICNVSEDDAATGNKFVDDVKNYAAKENNPVIVISAQIEQEIASLDTKEERDEFLETLGLEETGLAQVIRTGYQMLDLTTFFTVGPKEARAWTVKNGSSAPNAAGVIHTDFERGFICAETIAFDDYIKSGSEQVAKENGTLRVEGKGYNVKDGDVFHFRFNV